MAKTATTLKTELSIFVICGTPAQDCLARLRQWSISDETRLNRKKQSLITIAKIAACPTAADAVTEAMRHPQTSVVIFENAIIDEHAGPLLQLRNAGVVTLLYECHFSNNTLSQYPFQNGRVYSGAGRLIPLVEKCILRQWVNNHYEIRLVGGDELEEYFRLRFIEWSKEGYLSPALSCTTARMELNYTDRYAVPLGCYRKKKDGSRTLAALLRILRGLDVETNYANAIKSLVDLSGSQVLKHAFETQKRFLLPFDILETFPQFAGLYQKWAAESKKVAEISRVITRKADRRRGLAETLVDEACVYATTTLQKDKMILACKVEHAPLYARCGFRKLEMHADHFVGIEKPVDALPMERDLDPRHSSEFSL